MGMGVAPFEVGFPSSPLAIHDRLFRGSMTTPPPARSASASLFLADLHADLGGEHLLVRGIHGLNRHADAPQHRPVDGLSVRHDVEVGHGLGEILDLHGNRYPPAGFRNRYVGPQARPPARALPE